MIFFIEYDGLKIQTFYEINLASQIFTFLRKLYSFKKLCIHIKYLKNLKLTNKAKKSKTNLSKSY